MPGARGTTLVEFTDSYTANELAGSNGKALMPGFHLRVGAAAVKVMHNWGLHVFGGAFVTSAALPLLDVHLSAPIGSQNKVGIGNGMSKPRLPTIRVRWTGGTAQNIIRRVSPTPKALWSISGNTTTP
jgi:hypothetical protein